MPFSFSQSRFKSSPPSGRSIPMKFGGGGNSRPQARKTEKKIAKCIPIAIGTNLRCKGKNLHPLETGCVLASRINARPTTESYLIFGLRVKEIVKKA
jgi:hypothetical protein